MMTLSQTTATTGGGWVGGQQVLAEGGEGGADGLAGDLVEEAAGVQVDGARRWCGTGLCQGS
jgi:hypothetical protein